MPASSRRIRCIACLRFGSSPRAIVAPQLLELRHHVAVVGLEHELRQEALAHAEEFLGDRRRRHDLRRPEHLEDVRIGLQRQDQELLQLPIDLVGRRVLELLGNAEQRPVAVCRRQVDAAGVDVGRRRRQTVGARADEAAMDHRVGEFVILKGRGGALHAFGLQRAQQHELAPCQAALETVGQSHAVGVARVNRRFDDDRERASGVGAVRPRDRDVGDDAGAEGNDHQSCLRRGPDRTTIRRATEDGVVAVRPIARGQ
jgi:hypothetical protein